MQVDWITVRLDGDALEPDASGSERIRLLAGYAKAVRAALSCRFSAHLSAPPAADLPVDVSFEGCLDGPGIELGIDEQGTAEYGGFLEAVEAVEWDARMAVERAIVLYQRGE